jgi:hypothetical protein
MSGPQFGVTAKAISGDSITLKTSIASRWKPSGCSGSRIRVFSLLATRGRFSSAFALRLRFGGRQRRNNVTVASAAIVAALLCRLG